MDDLTEAFWELDIDAKNAAEHPLLTDADACNQSLVMSEKLVETRPPEEVCHIRWPEYRLHEKYRLELRTNKGVDWATSMRQIDAEMQRWQDDDSPIHNNRLGFKPWCLRPSAYKRAILDHKEENIFSLAIGPEFAVVMDSDKNGRSGHLWWFPIYRVEVEDERHWRRVAIERPKGDQVQLDAVANYQTCFALGKLLYLVDGQHLRIINVPEGRELARLPLYERAKLKPEFGVKRLVVAASGLALFQLVEQGAIYLCNLENEQLRMLKQFLKPQSGKGSYTAFSLSPCAERMGEALLGRSDGVVERWLLWEEAQTGHIKLKFDGELHLLGDKKSSFNLKTIKCPSDTPITYLYNRGRRTIVCTKYNRIVLEDTPQVPQFYFTENGSALVAEVDICGDMMVTLQDNGTIRGSPYISTISPIKMDRNLLDPWNTLQPGCQRLIVYPDMIVYLGPSGSLLFMNETKLIGARDVKETA